MLIVFGYAMYMLSVIANISCNYYPCIVEILSLHGKYGSRLMPMSLFGGFVIYETFLCVIPSPTVDCMARFIGIELNC